MKKLLSFAMFVMAFVQLPGQEIPEIKVPTHDSLQWHVRTTNFPVMKELYFEPIAGAPILSQPQRIDGGEWEIRTEEHGMIYPTLYDWNKDGKRYTSGQYRDHLLGNTRPQKSRPPQAPARRDYSQPYRPGTPVPRPGMVPNPPGAPVRYTPNKAFPRQPAGPGRGAGGFGRGGGMRR